MKKDEFLTYLVTLYGGFLDNQKQKLWLKDCSTVLEEDIDYSRFRLHFLHEFDTRSINNIPSPQWLYKESREFLINPKPKLACLKVYTAEEIQKEKGVPCPPEIREKMKALMAKEI